SFVMPGTMFLPGAGPAGTVAGILLGTVAMAIFAFNYHRMVQRTQGPGGALAFTTRAFGSDHGFLLAWFLWLTYVAILWANATSIVLLARYLFGNAFQLGFHYTMAGFDVYFGEVALCIAATALCGVACLFRRPLAAWLDTILVGVFLAGVATVFVAAARHHGGGLAAMAPAFSPRGGHAMQIVHILAMIPWAFVGFEAVVHSSAEFRFPVRRTFRILLAAIAISATVYILLALLPVIAFPDGYKTWSDYIDALPGLSGVDKIPVFAASRKAMGTVGVAVIGGTMLAAQLTGIFGTFIASSRLMVAMSSEGMIPSRFERLNRYGAPANAVLFVMCVSFLIPFLGRTVTGWPVDVSSLGAAIAYGYTSASTFIVARSDKGWRAIAEKATGLGGVAMAAVFCLLMLVPNYISGETLSAESYLVLAIWCLLGFTQYRHVFRVDWLSRFGHSTVVWVGVLIIIFVSSLMWFRLAICDASENAFSSLIGKTVDEKMVEYIMGRVSVDMLLKSSVELVLLLSSMAIILNLFSILGKREKRLLSQKLEAEESASKSRSYFFSTVSHDIRTPLNAIIGFSEMMKMGIKNETEREQAVDSILLSGRTLMRLINDVLDFSKLESGRMDIIPEPTDVTKLVDEIVESFRGTNNKPALEVRGMAKGLPRLLVDPQRIRQFLFNLVGNAMKFTKEGFVEVRATFTPDGSGEAGTFSIEVEDTGCGISEEDIKHIALPYEQVHSKEARHGGTGLGLAICRQLAKAMGGDIGVKSQLGKGSTFTVTLPGVKTCAEPVSPEAQAENLPQEASTAKRRILIVDDQKINLAVLKAMLKKLGDFDVETAADGKQALAVLEADPANPFCMVLTDMWMPELNGEGLVKAMRADPRFADMPVHVVTADVEMLKKYDKAGFSGILLKPVTVDKLKGVIS
ncbi:MAG: amino acid permease, partial [Kiritimatiellae bacterium]|nr:amino acid permease [Kiritimatiellia bacterium]